MNCLRCGRPLKNLDSIKRGYGPGCAKKMKLEDIKDNVEHAKEIEELDGQINILDEIKQRKCS
ncbi:DUF6011 domain-containing protein [Tissierella sp. Yu-01]|uniref:DUF6011 domain-containing protein n=1 Tax=Tissierella sp. Yu-01 TaxID=3035694 RepID=UPI00321A8E0A